MLIINPNNQNLHNPEFEIFEGEIVPHAEQPVRAERILAFLEEDDYPIKNVSVQIPQSILEQVHDKKYISFLKNFCQKITDDRAYFPSVFPKNLNQNLENKQAAFGFFSLDTYTPLMKDTFEAVMLSAGAAYEASQVVQSGGHKACYALCRPPGHHADISQMGGYCYLNNAAIAAQYLSKFGKVAILDLDFHHGNGTQNIFYKREDVFYISLHADPNWKFPHLSGFEDEIGAKKGRGFNRNFPLKAGIGTNKYTQTLNKALHIVQKFEADFLVVSLGLDTHQADPIAGFSLSTDYYFEMGKMVRKLNVPTVIIQEGGYNIEVIGPSLLNFLTNFRE